MSFTRCVRNAIEKFEVRHRRKWNEREIRNGKFVFAEIGGDRSRIAVTDCRPRPLEESGVLVLASHGIAPNAKRINMKTEWLERILAAARENGVAVLSFDELPLR